jgi:hypothetical protein
MIKFTIGADPELFFKDAAGNFVSSIGLIGGSKDKPRPIGNGCAVQEDNVAVEFNIPACSDLNSFVSSLNYNLTYLDNFAKEKNLELAIVPSAEFSKDQLNSQAARTFGCEPDYNAWTRSMNPSPKCDNPNLRSAGGHIHVGFNKSKLNFEQVVRAMDIFVGCEMLTFDKDSDRRKLYGKAGAFRPKEYGVEYRTASNAWIRTDELKAWVYAQTQKALEFVAMGKVIPDNGIGEVIQSCINNSDESLLKDVRAYATA